MNSQVVDALNARTLSNTGDTTSTARLPVENRPVDAWASRLPRLTRETPAGVTPVRFDCGKASFLVEHPVDCAIGRGIRGRTAVATVYFIVLLRVPGNKLAYLRVCLAIFLLLAIAT